MDPRTQIGENKVPILIGRQVHQKCAEGTPRVRRKCAESAPLRDAWTFPHRRRLHPGASGRMSIPRGDGLAGIVYVRPMAPSSTVTRLTEGDLAAFLFFCLSRNDLRRLPCSRRSLQFVDAFSGSETDHHGSARATDNAEQTSLDLWFTATDELPCPSAEYGESTAKQPRDCSETAVKLQRQGRLAVPSKAPNLPAVTA